MTALVSDCRSMSTQYFPFFINSTVFLVCFSLGLAGPDTPILNVSVTPASPLVDEPVTVSCKTRKRIGPIHYMEFFDDKKRVLLHQYSEDITERRGPWEGRRLETAFDQKTMNLSVTFNARPSDNGVITCRMVMDIYPNDKVDSSASVLLSIQRPPEILSFRLSREGPHGTRVHPDNRFVEGDNVRAECKVSLGHPQANVRLVTPGHVEMPQTELRQMKDVYNYNTSTVSSLVKVSYMQDGAIFQCKTSNKHEDINRKIQLTVLYKVRDLFFHYPNGTRIEVGSHITCQAGGNPAPTINITAMPVNITLTRTARSLRWTRPLKLPRGRAELKIPDDAPLGDYKLVCETINTVSNVVYRVRSRPVVVLLIRSRVPVTTALPSTTDQTALFNLSHLPKPETLKEKFPATAQTPSPKTQINITAIVLPLVVLTIVIIAIIIIIFLRRNCSSTLNSYLSRNAEAMEIMSPKSDQQDENLLENPADQPSDQTC